MEHNTKECTVSECEPKKGATRLAAPAVDIGETEEEFVVIADLPGSTREEIDIHLEKNILTIRAEARTNTQPDSMLLREFRPRGFERRFEIGEHVDGENVSADYRDGVLTVRLPKAAASKPRKIPLVN